MKCKLQQLSKIQLFSFRFSPQIDSLELTLVLQNVLQHVSFLVVISFLLSVGYHPRTQASSTYYFSLSVWISGTFFKIRHPGN